jgi:dipeptidyl aminopeptidase/acylaminoacyl peptidase
MKEPFRSDLGEILRSILDRQPPPFDQRVPYGGDPNQFAHLRFPSGRGPSPLLFVVHGGFWQSVYDLSHIGHLCTALTSEGVITCSIEYRRIGNPGGGWPGTFQDISLATRKIMQKVSNDSRFDGDRTAIVGHSAGGHLALWLVGSHRTSKTSQLHNGQRQDIGGAVSLAGVSDLRLAWSQKLGRGIVTRLMGGTPDEHPERYNAGSPIELLPTGSRHVLVHGANDDTVPISQSEAFVEKAERLGDRPSLIRLEGVGHYELIDPESAAWPAVVGAILSLFDVDRRH